MTSITIKPLASGNLGQFIRLPHRIYAHDPNWIPPLDLERRMHLAPGNPYFQHAYWQGWIAFKENQPVGRISAQIDRLYLNHHNGETGFFGMLEAIDDGAVFERLFSEAETWLIKQGMRCIQGPFNLSINHECGLLVEGFDRPPVVMMPYNPPYYATQLQRLGYQKVKDLLAYDLDASVEPPAAARNLARKAAQSIHVRPLRRRRLHEEFEILRGIFNDAWADNWGFVPFTREEFADMAGNLRHIIDDDFVQIAELDGEAVGMIVAIPDLNQLLLGLDGRLLPFNWLRLLWRWRTRYPDGGRVILMGVRRRYRQSLLGAAIAYLLVEALRKPVLAKGIRRMELSWILEDNQRMRGVIESLGAVCYKRYRIFTKALT